MDVLVVAGKQRESGIRSFFLNSRLAGSHSYWRSYGIELPFCHFHCILAFSHVVQRKVQRDFWLYQSFCISTTFVLSDDSLGCSQTIVWSFNPASYKYILHLYGSTKIIANFNVLFWIRNGATYQGHIVIVIYQLGQTLL